MKKKLDQYRGRLALKQIADGMNIAQQNAQRLYEDAKSMLEAGSTPTALALAILSIEEAGKVSILRRMVTGKTDEQVSNVWKEYRSHTKKNVAWAILDVVQKDKPTRLDDLRPLFEETAEHPFILDQLKQLAFYTDCLGKGKWSDPRKAIGAELAHGIVFIARIMCRNHEVTSRELQLWQQHVGDAAQTGNLKEGRVGLASWYAAMQAEGLFPDGPNAMESFVTGGINVFPRQRTSE